MLFDLFERDEGSVFVIDPFAPFFSGVPVGVVFDIIGPPGKGAALFGACFVYGAYFFVFEKDAIVILRIFFEGVIETKLTGIFFEKIFA